MDQTEAIFASDSGKTSLLFQFAINRATESGRGVVFICSKGRLENNPPSCPKYVEDGEGIRRYFAAYLLLDNFPAAFVVDDFAEFFSERSCQRRYGNTRARDLAVVHILALCQKAIAHANAKLGTLGSCNLLLSDVHLGDTPRSLFIYKRWISSIYTIQGDALGARILRTQEHWQFTKWNKEARTAKYSIAVRYLVIEEISNG